MNRWVDVAYRQACKKIAREKSERATFCIASITTMGWTFFWSRFLIFKQLFLTKNLSFFHYRICTERRRKRGEFRGMNQNRTSCYLMRKLWTVKPVVGQAGHSHTFTVPVSIVYGTDLNVSKGPVDSFIGN